MSFFVAALAFFQLRLKPMPLIFGIVEFAESVGNLHLSDKYLPTLGQSGSSGFCFERRDGRRELVNNCRLHKLLFRDH